MSEKEWIAEQIRERLRFYESFTALGFERGETSAPATAPAVEDSPEDLVGDLVDRGSDPAEWDSFVATMAASLDVSGIPWRAVPGNHDRTGTGFANYEAYVGSASTWASLSMLDRISMLVGSEERKNFKASLTIKSTCIGCLFNSAWRLKVSICLTKSLARSPDEKISYKSS